MACLAMICGYYGKNMISLR
ncbi:hypothetical protein [Klebsiella pneumoniae]|nr:hypothetical protein [Klebsiella pneumoniae]